MLEDVASVEETCLFFRGRFGFYSMLVLLSTLRKNSLGGRPDRRRAVFPLGYGGEPFPGLVLEQDLGDAFRERRVGEQGVPDTRPAPPRG
jgi:hypothetical protein